MPRARRGGRASRHRPIARACPHLRPGGRTPLEWGHAPPSRAATGPLPIRARPTGAAAGIAGRCRPAGQRRDAARLQAHREPRRASARTPCRTGGWTARTTPAPARHGAVRRQPCGGRRGRRRRPRPRPDPAGRSTSHPEPAAGLAAARVPRTRAIRPTRPNVSSTRRCSLPAPTCPAHAINSSRNSSMGTRALPRG